jgi:hypothetical protein
MSKAAHYHYISRADAMERLRLGLRASFRLLPSCRGLVSTRDILELLNRSRHALAEPLLEVPTDIMTAEELAAVPELAGSGITAKRLLLWTQRRAVRIPPHFHINKHTVRFSKAAFLEWLDRPRRRKSA